MYDFKTFCEDSKLVYNHPYDCEAIFGTANQNDTAIREFFSKMNVYGVDQREHQYGFTTDGMTICVNKQDL